MKSIFLNILLTLVGLFSFAQTVEKSSVDSGGANSSAGNISILYTIGEVNVKEVSTPNLSVSEGFIGPLGNCNLVISQSAENLVLVYDGSGNTHDVNTWLENNGNAVVNNACGDVTWSYEIIDDFLVDTDFDFVDDRLNIEIEFTAIDTEGNEIVTTAFIIFDDFATAGESAGNGSTICEDTFPISDFDNDLFFDSDGIDYNDAKFDSSSFQLVQTAGKPGLQLQGTDVKFPDTGAGQFTYNFDFKVQTTVTIGNKPPRTYETTTFYTANNVTVAFDPGPNINIVVCDFNNLSLLDLYNELEIALDVDTSEFNEVADFGNVFEPENSWYNQFDDLEANPNTPSLTEITEPGIYQFNAKKFLEDCAGEPVFITIEFNEIDQPSEILVITYDPNGNDTEIDAWLNNNGGITMLSDEGVVWTYELDYFELDDPFESDSLFIYLMFNGVDECGTEYLDFGTIEIQGFPFAGETNQEEGVVCSKSINLNGINGVNFESNKYSNSIVNVSGPGTINGFDVDFPDTGAGQFSYGYSFSVSTNVSIGTLNFNVDDGASWLLDNVTISFDPGPDQSVCESEVNSLADLFAQLEVVDGTTDPLFDPDDFWFDTNGQPITTYTGPGEYIFNAEGFLPQCGGIPATVTVVSCDILISPKVTLQGPSLNPYSGEETLMRDDLRVIGLLPTTSPYQDNLVCNASVFNTTGPNAIVDWIWVQLRDENNSSNVVSERSALIQRDGDVVDLDGTSNVSFDVTDGNYFVSIKHRNHLGIMSALPITLSTTTTILDFSNGSTALFGTNATTTVGMPGGVLGMWAGDTSNDNIVQYAGGFPEGTNILSYVLNDFTNFLNLPTFAINGYSDSDVNMDGIVQYAGGNSEMPYILQNILSNSSNFLNLITFPIEAQLPENTSNFMAKRNEFQNRISNDN